MITVKNDVPVYAVNERQTTPPERVIIEVHSHSIHPDRVILCLSPNASNPQYITVIAKDLEAAIKNATNSARW